MHKIVEMDALSALQNQIHLKYAKYATLNLSTSNMDLNVNYKHQKIVKYQKMVNLANTVNQSIISLMGSVKQLQKKYQIVSTTSLQRYVKNALQNTM